MKTWVLYSMALAVATGQPWLGNLYGYDTKKTNVLILDYEMGKNRALRRFKLLAKNADVKGLFFKRGGGDLHSEKTWEWIAKVVKAKNIGMVLIDSLAAGAGGGPAKGDENDTRFAFPLIKAGLISDDAHCTFVFLHHAKKGDSKSNEIMRGTSALQAAADTIYRFSTPEGSVATALRCKMQLAKAGDGEQAEDVSLILTDQDGLQRDFRPAAVNDSDDEVLAYLKANPDGVLGYRKMAKDLGRASTTMSDTLKRLEEEGKVFSNTDLAGGRKCDRWMLGTNR